MYAIRSYYVPRATSSYLLFGSPAYAQVNRQIVYLNSAFLLDQGGATMGRSDKRNNFV